MREALADLDESLREVTVDGRSLHARADSGSTAVPAVLATGCRRIYPSLPLPSLAFSRRRLSSLYRPRLQGRRPGGIAMRTSASIAAADGPADAGHGASAVLSGGVAHAAGHLASTLWAAVQERDGDTRLCDSALHRLSTPGVVVMIAMYSNGWSGMQICRRHRKGSAGPIPDIAGGAGVVDWRSGGVQLF